MTFAPTRVVNPPPASLPEFFPLEEAPGPVCMNLTRVYDVEAGYREEVWKLGSGEEEKVGE